MKRLFIKSFNKREDRARRKFGQSLFLKKYIKKYSSYTKTNKWLLPLVVFLCLINAAIWLFQYLAFDSEVIDLIVFVLWGLAFVLWLITTLQNYLYVFTFIDEKLESWEKESNLLQTTKDNN